MILWFPFIGCTFSASVANVAVSPVLQEKKRVVSYSFRIEYVMSLFARMTSKTANFFMIPYPKKYDTNRKSKPIFQSKDFIQNAKKNIYHHLSPRLGYIKNNKIQEKRRIYA